MKDVAELAGVSQRTVSNVLGKYPHVTPYTRDRVLAAVEQLGYRPNIAAQQLRMGVTKTIALVLPNLSWPYFGEIAHLVQKEAQRAGYRLLIAETEGSREREAAVLSNLGTNLIDGVILSSIELDTKELDDLRIDAPLVLLGEMISGATHPHYTIDNVEAARELTWHLHSQGVRRFALLGATATKATASAGVLRRAGFEQALVEAGVTTSAGTARYDHLPASPWTAERGRAHVAEWVRRNPLPDAIVALNDLLAAGALRALSDAEINVPGEVLLTGWDGTVISKYATPSMTTVSPNKAAIAQHAVRGLISLIEGNPTPAGDVFVEHSIKIRESSLPIKTGREFLD
ncbi:LacI family DNA-binding transcriptional regulator [Actinomyces minihominis]|uniref:LacI family DNA-binding transcriptional regulator n=1 Tax=Actinomyces minihominis TaxID=2002838 RepID=UPI000C06F4FD|nr:LacI family DNA-binding transcriptional regulator [Actinomyces minihominis]